MMNKEKLKKEPNSVLEWVELVKKSLIEEYKDYKLVYLYVTTGIIPEKQKTEIKKSNDLVLFVDRKNLESYAPTNIFPYLVTPSSDEIQLLEFMELHKIEKKGTLLRTTKEDLENILDFLKVDKSEIRKKKLKVDLFDLALKNVKSECKKKDN